MEHIHRLISSGSFTEFLNSWEELTEEQKESANGQIDDYIFKFKNIASSAGINNPKLANIFIKNVSEDGFIGLLNEILAYAGSYGYKTNVDKEKDRLIIYQNCKDSISERVMGANLKAYMLEKMLMSDNSHFSNYAAKLIDQNKINIEERYQTKFYLNFAYDEIKEYLKSGNDLDIYDLPEKNYFARYFYACVKNGDDFFKHVNFSIPEQDFEPIEIILKKENMSLNNWKDFSNFVYQKILTYCNVTETTPVKELFQQYNPLAFAALHNNTIMTKKLIEMGVSLDGEIENFKEKELIRKNYTGRPSYDVKNYKIISPLMAMIKNENINQAIENGILTKINKNNLFECWYENKDTVRINGLQEKKANSNFSMLLSCGNKEIENAVFKVINELPNSEVFTQIATNIFYNATYPYKDEWKNSVENLIQKSIEKDVDPLILKKVYKIYENKNKSENNYINSVQSFGRMLAQKFSKNEQHNNYIFKILKTIDSQELKHFTFESININQFTKNIATTFSKMDEYKEYPISKMLGDALSSNHLTERVDFLEGFIHFYEANKDIVNVGFEVGHGNETLLNKTLQKPSLCNVSLYLLKQNNSKIPLKSLIKDGSESTDPIVYYLETYGSITYEINGLIENAGKTPKDLSEVFINLKEIKEEKIPSIINCLSLFEEMLKNGIDLNQKYNNGQTSMFNICEQASTLFVKLCVVEGGVLKIEDNSGHTPLNVTTDPETAAFLIDNGIFNKKDCDEIISQIETYTLFSDLKMEVPHKKFLNRNMVAYKNISSIKSFMNDKGEDFLISSSKKNLDLMQYILWQDPMIITNNQGKNCLHYLLGRYDKNIKYEENYKDFIRPEWNKIKVGFVDIVEKCVDLGVNIHQKSKTKETPFSLLNTKNTSALFKANSALESKVISQGMSNVKQKQIKIL